MKELNRRDLSLIHGGIEDGDGPTPFKSGGSAGGGDGACSASCDSGETHTVVTCSGPHCKAVDNEGCKSDTMKADCPAN